METLATVDREGRERLYPSLSNPSWLVLRKRREVFRAWFDRLGSDLLDVLDVGGRIQPYRPLLAGRLGRYVAVDLRLGPLVNIVARGQELPLASSCFDLVICTQVLEYIPDPALVIAEIRRVLKPGGLLVLSAPSVAPRDSDHECWRFLPAILGRLLSEFDRVEIVPEGGSIVGLFRSMNACMNIFCRFPMLRSIFRYTVFPAVNVAGVFFDSITNSKNDQFAPNYSVFAMKPTGDLNRESKRSVS